jgi:hypothetical protein
MCVAQMLLMFAPRSWWNWDVQEENMVTRGELAEKYTSAQDYEEDFM